MVADRNHHLGEILSGARERSGEEREAYLREACGADGELRRQVDALLAQETGKSVVGALTEAERTEALLRPFDRPAGPPTGGVPGGSIGPFRLLEVLGKGGMGVVHLAEQTEPVRRRVALKVVRRALRERSSVLRFAAERQAMARLSHPNVAQIYEAGTTDDGYPWLAMELVDGVPITRYCDDHRLGLRARLELFQRVCEGVEHAHQKGVLHRDLKPTNLLVAEIDGRAVPKIIDFGIAKATDLPLVEATLETAHGVFGTPAYMSPEAVAGGGAVDTRSDVYSLGVVLFQLLVGVRPFEGEGESFVDTLRRIAEDEPSRPSERWRALPAAQREELAARRGMEGAALARRLGGDLDWIVLRALAKDPAARYGSPSALAADLERHLRHEPVEARPPSLGYRFGRFARRHRAGVLAAALALLLLVGGLAGVAVGLLRAQRAEAKAVHEAERAGAAEARAVAEALRANREAQTTQTVSDFLVGLFQVADPNASGGGEVTAAELLDRGAERVRRELADQPAVQARLMSVIGDIYRNLGRYDEARGLLEEAVTLGESTPGVDARELGRLLNRLGVLERRTGHYAEAEALFARALPLWEEAYGPEDAKTAGLLNNLGNLYQSSGKLDLAAETLGRALAIWERELGPRHRDVGICLLNLGNVLNMQQRDAEAADYYLRAASIFEEVFGPDHPHLATALGNIGDAYLDLGRFDEAERYIRRALELRERAFGAEHEEVARILGTLGILYSRDGRGAQAEPLLEQAIATLTRSLGDHHRRLGPPLRALGDAQRDLGRPEAALATYRRAIAVFSANLPASEEELEATQQAAAAVLAGLGRGGEAASLEPATPGS